MLYTTKEMADILGISESLIKLRRREENLTFTESRGNCYLFSKEDIIAFAKKYNYKIDEFAFYTREELIQLVMDLKIEIQKLKNDKA